MSRTLQNLEDTDIAEEDIDAIREFIDHYAAEGLSEVRQNRHVQSLKAMLEKFAPDDFRLRGATEFELKQVIASLSRSEYAEATSGRCGGTVKKFYKIENGGVEHPDKVDFVSLDKKEQTRVYREDLFTKPELQRLFRSFSSTRDRAFTMILYEFVVLIRKSGLTSSDAYPRGGGHFPVTRDPERIAGQVERRVHLELAVKPIDG